jgi:ribosomal protein L16 Arg81 hydroxylase
MRFLTLILLLAGAAVAQQDDVLLTATHDKLNETVRQALAADPETLKQWAERAAKDETANKEFCPDYERRSLAALYRALAESKSTTGDKAREASAQAAWSLYQLAGARPATKQDLKQLLLRAKEGAPEVSEDDRATVWDSPTQVRIEKTLVVLEKPLPGRIRISQQTSECS